MSDFNFTQIEQISKATIYEFVKAMIEELHLDCSQKIDTEAVAHTAKKFTELLFSRFKTWTWDEIQRVSNQGISGEFGKTGERINYQTLSSWMRSAQNRKIVVNGDKSIFEAHQMAGSTVGNFRETGQYWKEFREWMEINERWFVDNISLYNCNLFHQAKKTGGLSEFIDLLATEPDPSYFEAVKKITLEQFKQQYEREQIFD